MISASVPMAEASFISAEHPLAPDLAADRAVLRTGGASRHHDIVFVVNPRESPSLLMNNLFPICESLTAGPCHAIDTTREAIREGADAIIAVGGDRTLHEGRKRRTTLFHNVTNTHLSAKAGHYASRYKTFGNICYVIGALQAFFGHHNQDLRIKVDDGDWEVYSQVTALCIGNAKCGGMKISPNAHSSSRTFEMAILQNFTWCDFVLKLHKLFNGTHLSVNNVSSRRACSIEVQQIVPSGNIFVQSDREYLGFLPRKFNILPGAIEMIRYLLPHD